MQAMKQLSFYFDVLSPYAYLAFERLPHELMGLSYSVDYRPLLLPAVLSHWGQKGPAEIEPKRAWAGRHLHWLARQHGVPFQLPAQHPFNPLSLLRLAWACAPEGTAPNRFVCEQIFRHVWQGGEDANDPARLVALVQRLSPQRDPQGEAVKQVVKEATAEAIAQGVFGVPAVTVDGRLFWGLEGLPMLAAWMRGDPTLSDAAWDESGRPSRLSGAQRQGQ
jgi:2-hydroxychromene-2-carboxylate isomerase